MRDFIVESVLPFVSVSAVIAGLTAAIFDVPSTEPSRAASATATTAQTPAPIPDSPSRPAVANDARREEVNQVLARAVRSLSESATPTASAIAPLGAPEPRVDPKVFGVVSKLGEAMRLAREARDDKDLAKAEELMRSARQEMDVACDKTGGSGPLCQSAEQIRSLGY